MKMRLTTDRSGNTSFGDEIIRTLDGVPAPTRCKECRAELTVMEQKLRAELCGECVEKIASSKS